jgi:pimeloyl-ACP methyl ester carboxylesterase
MSQPIVLIPGLNCTAELYAPQMKALAARAPVVIADHRSDDTLAGIVERLLASAPERFALAGLSMGGYVSFEVMRRAPERVTRLALLDTSAKPATDETNAVRRELIAMAEAGEFPKVQDILWQRLVAPARRGDRSLREIAGRMAEETGPAGFVRQQKAIMGRPDSRPGLGAIAVPTLVLVGEDDILTPPAEAYEMAMAIPGATLVEISACGHLATLEAPEAVTAALEHWLAA